MSRELLSAPATELARLIRRREVSSLEVVDAHIARIEAVDDRLGAVVGRGFDRARELARAADDTVAIARADDELPPLWGVPCTIKEFLSVEGLPHTAGLVARRDVVGDCDATVVARLRRAGAIVVGVTNVPEGGMWMETANKVYGRTANPWDLARTPGGSSGGEGAIIAAGGSAFGIGSDIAGSVRIPAAFCGIAAHKPTGGWVPNTGHWGVEDGGTSFLTCGPMARSVRDLPAILSIIAGPDGLDPLARARPFAGAWSSDRRGGDLVGVTVVPVESVGRVRVREPMRRAVREAADILAMRGAQVRPGVARRVEDALEIWLSAMRAMTGERGVDFAEILGGGESIDVWTELVRAAFGRGHYTLPAVGLAALDRVAGRLLSLGPLARRFADGAGRVARLRTELERELGPRGVLLIPPYSRTAPRHGVAMLSPFDFVGTAIFNLLEFPATQVPLGIEPRARLPVGVQVASGRGNDALALAVAAVLEDETGRPRGPVDPRPARTARAPSQPDSTNA